MTAKNLPNPPLAEQIPYAHKAHGHERSDPYAWLRNATYPEPVTDPKILAYIEAENAYTAVYEKTLEPLTQTIFEELKGRMKENDASVPYQDGAYWYYSRFEAGSQYPLYCRKKGTLDAPEEIILDVPALAQGHDYYKVGALSLNPDHRLLAYSVDTNGSERFTLFIKDLTDASATFETIPHIMGGAVWDKTGQHIFYTHVDENWRYNKVFRHVLGQSADQDTLIYEESDIGYFVSVSETQDGNYILINSHGHEENEIYAINSAHPLDTPQRLRRRQNRVEYDVEHWQGTWVTVINDTGPNGRLIQIPIGHFDQATELLTHSAERYLMGVVAFKDRLVLTGREAGLPAIFTYTPAAGISKLTFEDAAYEVALGTNAQYDTQTLRLGYSAMGKPLRVMDYDFASGTYAVKKIQEIPSGFDPDLYVTERLLATARDGVQVPISLIYRKGLREKGPAPLLLYGYGSYGYSMPASFSSSRFSLIDRGVIYAIAHIRGGSEMGKEWYENGKFLNKKNTFNDFVDAAKHLIQTGHTQAGKIAIWGGSAGGLLMGASLNQAPELYASVIAEVPFVDTLTTMLDTSLPLTVPEYKEWGNPQEKIYYDDILSYSPYDNVVARHYPAIFAHAGLNDPRVTYWEAAKWVAKLRAAKAEAGCEALLLLKTDMDKGHGAASGRYDSLRELAEKQAFVLDCFGMAG
jgi:oligopeptidase B